MNEFHFRILPKPFPRWLGPYSPARGTRSGFRFHYSRLGAWIGQEDVWEFWPLLRTPGVGDLEELILDEWGGGRVLLLPDGLVIKPLPGDDEVGQRVILGKFQGPVKLMRPDGSVFDLSREGGFSPGGPWPGPNTIGVECIILPDGKLICKWDQSTRWGRERYQAVVHGEDKNLRSGFRLSRPGVSVGRVRVTANGIVITNFQDRGLNWHTRYVGKINVHNWITRKEWIVRNKEV